MPVMSAVERVACSSAPWRAIARRGVLPWALAGVELHGDVLETGAGSGAMAAGVLARFPSVRLTVTDLDPAMVRSAERRLGDRARVMTADVTELPFPEHSFDFVTSYLMLHHVLDWPRALASAARVLRPGGGFLGYDILDTRAARLVHRLDRSPYRLMQLSEIRPALAAAGFGDCRVVPSGRGHLVRFQAHIPLGSAPPP